MYCVYGESHSSLLIESTDFMITVSYMLHSFSEHPVGGENFNKSSFVIYMPWSISLYYAVSFY